MLNDEAIRSAVNEEMQFQKLLGSDLKKRKVHLLEQRHLDFLLGEIDLLLELLEKGPFPLPRKELLDTFRTENLAAHQENTQLKQEVEELKKRLQKMDEMQTKLENLETQIKLLDEEKKRAEDLLKERHDVQRDEEASHLRKRSAGDESKEKEMKSSISDSKFASPAERKSNSVAPLIVMLLLFVFVGFGFASFFSV